MDEVDQQTISISLAQYLDLRERANRNQSIKLESVYINNRRGANSMTSSGISWHLPENDPGSKLALSLTQRISDLIDQVTGYRSRFKETIQDFSSMSYREFRKWQREARSKNFDEYFDDEYAVVGSESDEREIEKAALKSARSLIRDIAGRSQMALNEPEFRLPQDIVDKIPGALGLRSYDPKEFVKANGEDEK